MIKQKIPFSLAAPGMKLAKPITNEQGMTLCGEGTELTEVLINRLSNMEVTRIVVEGHPVDTGKPEKNLDQLVEELHARFIQVETDPLMLKIKTIILERLKKKLS
jgi:hypothetical protein